MFEFLQSSILPADLLHDVNSSSRRRNSPLSKQKLRVSKQNQIDCQTIFFYKVKYLALDRQFLTVTSTVMVFVARSKKSLLEYITRVARTKVFYGSIQTLYSNIPEECLNTVFEYCRRNLDRFLILRGEINFSGFYFSVDVKTSRW